MSRSLTLQLVMNARENISGPLAAVFKGSKRTTNALRDQSAALRKLQKSQSDVTSLRQLSQEAKKTSTELSAAERQVETLRSELEKTNKPTRAMTRDFNAAQKAADKLRQRHARNNTELARLRSRLGAAGVNTDNLADEQTRLAHAIDRANHAVDRQKNRLNALHRVQERANKITGAGGKVANEASRLATKGVVAAGVGGYFFKTQLLDTAAEFENYEAVLKVVEGSSEKARKSLNWVSDMAAKTPYELAEVTEAFVKLRSYGLDPTNGLLKTLGDTSSAMNKDLLQAVEAMADAVTGENERLKEFGIRASKSKGKITYEYTDKAGNQKTLSAADDDRKAIESTLRTIWNEKFAGAMRERSRTWSGMVSNMSDQWTRFSNMIMGAGLFDWMKSKLSGLLSKIDAMAADGSLQKLAADWGTKLTLFATGVWNASEAIISATSKLADMAGGGENLIMILAGIQLAPLIASVVSLGVALGPVGWTLAGIAALVTGITYAFKNWDKISDWFGEKFGPDDDFTSSSDARRRSRKPAVSSRKPITAASAQGNTRVDVGGITINPAPGMDERAIGEEVTRQIKHYQRQSSVRGRSKMKDDD